MDVRDPNLNIKKIILRLSLGLGILLGMWPVAEASAQEQILVSNYTNNTVKAYARLANGDIAPALSIATESGPHHIAVNHGGREVVVSNNLTYSVTVYDTDTGALKRTIAGALTGLNRPTGVAVDERNAELYVANDYSNAITVYPLLANGNVAPIRTIQGLLTQIEGPSGMAVDLFNDQLLVVNYSTSMGGGSITVYPRTANGNIAPVQKIQGAATGLHLPQGIALDMVNKEILVANSEFGTPNGGGVWVFLRGDTGDVAPFRLLYGPATQLCNPMGIAVDLVRDEIVVANSNFGNGTCGQSVTTFQRTATVGTAPLRVVSSGANSGLSTPLGVDFTTAPVIVSVSGPSGTQPVGVSVPVVAAFKDTVQTPHSCSLNWGDGITTAGVIVENSPTNISGSCTGAHTYTAGGAYSVVAAVSNGASGSGSSSPFLVVAPPANTSPNKIVFSSTRDGNEEIYSMSADGTGVTRLTSNPAIDVFPVWSPDKTKIAFTSTRSGVADVYVMSATGTGVTRLTANAKADGKPMWSPNGQKIAFTSNRDGNFEVYVMNADGSAQTRLTNNSASDSGAAWSPDGTKLAFTSNRDGDFEIYVMNANGSGVTKLTSNNSSVDFDPDWSPDGSKIVFASNRDGTLNFEIYSMNANGSGIARLTTGSSTDIEPAWSPNGAQILFTSNRNGLLNLEIYSMNANGSNVVRLTNNSALDTSADW